ncbi:MAG TPA: hypothetical protein VF997_13005, partial [Polyangia bacterium]
PPTWRDQCAERLDAAANAAGMRAGARRDTVPLLREDGSPNPMQLVEYGDAGSAVMAMVGNENERRRDKPWTMKSQAGGKAFVEWFRRAHGMFAKLTLGNPAVLKPFQAALDDCLKMGEAK